MFQWIRWGLARAVLALLVSSTLHPLAPAATAATVNCTPSPGYTHCQRVTYSGSLQSFSVPATYQAGQPWAHLLIETWGAGGGGSSYGGSWTPNHGGASGGYSKTVVGGLQVGDTLNIVVGQGGGWGRLTSTYGGGGPAGSGNTATSTLAASGGGFSGVFLDAALTQPLVIAGGGGGASAGAEAQGGPFGGGGTGAAPAPSNAGLSGGPGTLLAGGAGATSAAGCTRATAGTYLQGGSGAGRAAGGVEGGGGGGGGYFGGGGGTCQGGQQNGGGGGGSAYVDPVKVKVLRSANGLAGIMGGSAAVALQGRGDQYVAGVGVGGLGDSGGTRGDPGGNGMVVIQWSQTAPVLPTPFVCGSTFYEVKNKTLRKMVLEAPAARQTIWNTSWQDIGAAGASNLNALVYNDFDNYLYAINQSDQLVRISSSGSQVQMDTFGGTLNPDYVYDSAAYLGNGILYFQGRSASGTIGYQVDTTTPIYPTLVQASVRSPAQDAVGDLAAVAGSVVGVHTLNTQSIIRVDAATGLHTRQTITGIQVDSWPSAWSSNGALFARYNTSTAGIFRIDLGSPGSYTRVANTPIESATPVPTLDGASCGTASTPFPSIQQPALTPDVSTGNFDTNQTIVAVTNDLALGLKADGAANTMLGTSVRICAAAATDAQCLAGGATHLVTSLTVAGQGTYTVQADGSIVFNPLNTFTGTATPVRYTASDSNNQFGIATITPTVAPPAASTAGNTSTYGKQRTTTAVIDQYSTVSSTVSVPLGVTFNLNTLRLCTEQQAAMSTSVRDCNVAQGTNVRATATPQGSFKADAAGGIYFYPDQWFTGVATAVTYQFTDSLGRKFWGTYQPTVAELPVASSDSVTANYGTIPTLNLYSNDTVWQPTDNSNRIVGSGAKICVSTVTDDLCNQYTSFSIYDIGNFSLNTTTGLLTFTPCTGSGKPYAAPWCTRAFVSSYTIKYRIQDNLGQFAFSTATFSVTPPPISATGQTVSTIPGQAVQFTALTGVPSLASGTALTSCLFVSNACDADNSVVVAGKGTFVLNTTTRVVTFTPAAGLVAPDSISITYRVQDVINQTASATLVVRIPAPPVLGNDAVVAVQNRAQEFTVLSNDSAGDVSVSLDPGSIRLCATTTTAPTSCTLTQLSIAGQGTFDVLSNGILRFTPVSGYSSSVSAVAYRAIDGLGQAARASINVTVLPPPAPLTQADALSTNYAASSTINLLANDSVEMPTSGYTSIGQATLDPSTLRLCAPNETVSNCSLTSVTTAAGTYSLNGALVTFQANLGYVGPDLAAPRYRICIAASGTWAPQNPPLECSTGPISNAVGNAPAPTLGQDSQVGPMGQDLVLNVLANDTSAAGLTLVTNSLKICHVTTSDPNLCAQTEIVIPNQGKYTVDENSGLVTFVPLAGFSGVASPISYSLADSSSLRSLGSVAAEILAPPVTGNFTTQAFSGVTQSQTVAVPPSGSIALLDSSNNPVRELTFPSVGTYRVDIATGVITFIPAPGYSGVAPAAPVQVTDRFGQSSVGSYQATVNSIPPTPPPPAPALSDDTYSVIRGLTASGSVLTNDTIPQGAALRVVSYPLSGTLNLHPNGSFSYQPPSGFTGTSTFVYEVCHPAPNESVCSTATASVTVSNPVVPSLVSDSGSAAFGQQIVGSVAGNDSIPAGSTISVSSFPANGTLQFLTDGSYTFVPNPGFSGSDSFVYEVCLPSPHQADCVQSTVNLSISAQQPQQPQPPQQPQQPQQPHNPPAQSSKTVATPQGGDVVTPLESQSANASSCIVVDSTSGNCLPVALKPGVGEFRLLGGQLAFDVLPDFVGRTEVMVRTIRDGVVEAEQTVVFEVQPAATSIIRETAAGNAITAKPELKQDSKVCLALEKFVECKSSIVMEGVGTWTLATDNHVTFTPAAGFLGKANVWLVEQVGSVSRFHSFEVSVFAAPRNKIVRLVLPGFRDGSAVLTSNMKARIGHFMRVNQGYAFLQCQGWTEGPTILSTDRKLAQQRSNVACRFAISVAFDSLKVKSKTYSNSIVESPKLRRIVLTLTTNF